jgi:hypothetical protein
VGTQRRAIECRPVASEPSSRLAMLHYKKDELEAIGMPSPFPGMDPFLEEPAEWTGVHTQLLAAISYALTRLLAPNYSVKIEQRVYIVAPDDLERQQIVPDVYVINGRNPSPALKPVGTITAPTLVEPLYEPEIRDRYIEIRDARSREVITTIELLSPFNKAAGTQGRAAFERKRRLVMSTKVHWIEIDLLRLGDRPFEMANQSDYYVLLKRGIPLAPYEVWYINLRDRLPTIGVPLGPSDDDVPLDLQAVFDDMYSRSDYADSIDYTGRVPPPQLRPDDAAWVQSRIQAWFRKRNGDPK